MITPFYSVRRSGCCSGPIIRRRRAAPEAPFSAIRRGREYLRSHVGHAFSGVPPLRPWFSCPAFRLVRIRGYSAGECFEGGEPGSWMQDLQEAVTELKDMAGVRTFAVVGLRLGAAMGAQLAQQGGDVNRLVLWDPVVDGGAYIETLLGDSGTKPLEGLSGPPRRRRPRDS